MEVSTFLPRDRILQEPAAAAVVVPTVLRPTLVRAIESVFTQKIDGRVQILIGIDKRLGPDSVLEQLYEKCPANCFITLVDLGYSTAQRNGGLHPGGSGGVLRTILSYVANSRFVAYLDDDNWWHEDHLASLLESIEGHNWSYSLRWYVDQASGEPLCVDEWEAVGPDVGAFKNQFGGFVDPNTLMIDKLACEPVLRWWTVPVQGDRRAMSEDRNVFHHLKSKFTFRGTGRATCYYVIQPSDAMHRSRMRWIKERLEQARESRAPEPAKENRALDAVKGNGAPADAQNPDTHTDTHAAETASDTPPADVPAVEQQQDSETAWDEGSVAPLHAGEKRETQDASQE